MAAPLCSEVQSGWLRRWGTEVSGGDLSRSASTYASTQEVFKEESTAEARPGPSGMWPLLRLCPGPGQGSFGTMVPH